MDKTLSKIVDNVPLALIIVGLALVLVGAAGAVPFTDLKIDGPWRVTVIVPGLLIAALGALLIWYQSRNPGKINPSRYKVQITSLRDGEAVDRHFEIAGSYAKALPIEYTVAVVEFNAANRTYRPRQIAITEKGRRWRAVNVFSGDVQGQEKFILVGLIGPAGKILFDYWEKVGRTYNYQNRPAIDGFEGVFSECDRVRVRVK
jgi:hypothetical protein